MNCLDLYDELDWLKQQYSNAKRNQKFYKVYTWEQQDKNEEILTKEELRKVEDEKLKEIDKLENFLKNINVKYKIKN